MYGAREDVHEAFRHVYPLREFELDLLWSRLGMEFNAEAVGEDHFVELLRLRAVDDERLAAVVRASTRADAADRGKRRGGAMEVSAGSSESGGRSTRHRRDYEWEDDLDHEVPRP